MGSHGPEDDEDDAPGEQVADHQQVVQNGHCVGGVDIEDVDEQDHGEDEQRAVPVLRRVVWIADRDEALDDGAREERARCCAGLPCENGHPAWIR